MARASRRHDRAAGKDARRAPDSARVSAEPSQGAGDIKETWWPLTWARPHGEDDVPVAKVNLAGFIQQVHDTRGRFSLTSDYNHDFCISDMDSGENDYTMLVYGDELELRCALIELARKHRKNNT
jgi:hypothetical protein